MGYVRWVIELAALWLLGVSLAQKAGFPSRHGGAHRTAETLQLYDS